MQSQNLKTSIILYDDRLELRLDSSQDTIWASLDEIAHIFGRDKSVISRHIKNIFQENELDKNQVVAKNATTAKDGKIYQVDYYNLDMILSIGYRVNSKVATWFRQWATNRLKEYLIHGYTINHNRLKELQKTIELISLQKENPDLSLAETRWLLDIISNYTESFLLLDRFDSWDLSGIWDDNITYTITYEDAKNAILQLKETLIDKKEDTGLFWNEKDDQFIGILRSIIVTFDGNTSIRRSKNRRLICYTSSSRIILFQMEISESVRFSLSGFWRKTIIVSGKMEHQKSMNRVSLLSLFS